MSSAAMPPSSPRSARFLGHLFPVWLKFKGGKGVATYIGLLLGFKVWPALVGFCAIWLAVAALTRYSSLAALVASAATPVILWWTGDVRLAELFLLLSVLLWIMHRANIARLSAARKARSAADSRRTLKPKQFVSRPRPARAPARRGCAGSCRRTFRRNDRSRPQPYAAAAPRRNGCARPDRL